MRPEKKSRKQEILEAALVCFNEHGIEATTIEMIRERSNASVGSLYHHFGSKEKIAAALYLEALAEHHAYQQELLERAETPEAGVKAVAFAYVDWVSVNPDKARFVLYNRGTLAKTEMAEEMKTRSKAHVGDVRRWFEPYFERRQLKKLPQEVYASLIVGPAHDYARLWLSGRAKTDIKAYREIFADAAWNAVKP
jgi:AcrR family transcriptional regulator